METKFFRMAIKELNDEGHMTGYLSAFNNVDRGKDLIRPGSFTQTLQDTESFPLLWAHSANEPHLVVGTFAGRQDKHGLFIEADFLTNLPGGKDAYETVKTLKERKVKVGLSIGYEAINSKQIEIDGESVREITEIKLYEGSLTLFPMNDQATVQSIKATEDALNTVSKDRTVRVICSECGKPVMEIYDPISEKALDAPKPVTNATSETEPPIVEDIAANRWYLDLEKKVRDLKSI